MLVPFHLTGQTNLFHVMALFTCLTKRYVQGKLIYVDEIDQEIPNLCLLYIASSSRAGSVQYGYIQSLKRELQSFAHNIRFSVCYQNQNIDQLLLFR